VISGRPPLCPAIIAVSTYACHGHAVLAVTLASFWYNNLYELFHVPSGMFHWDFWSKRHLQSCYVRLVFTLMWWSSSCFSFLESVSLQLVITLASEYLNSAVIWSGNNDPKSFSIEDNVQRMKIFKWSNYKLSFLWYHNLYLWKSFWFCWFFLQDRERLEPFQTSRKFLE